MKKNYFLSFQALFLIVGLNFLHAQYTNGVLIANEGGIGSYNASLSYFDYDTQQVSHNIYQDANNDDIGDVLQNIGIYEDKAYLVVNNSNKILVVDRSSIELQETITENIDQPRYITFANGKYYVTGMVNKNVSIYDIETNQYQSEIVFETQVEEIEAIGNHVFVQGGWYSSGEDIFVIDATTDQFVETIPVEFGLNGIVSDENFLYVLSSGPEYTHIYKIDGETLDIISDVRTTDITGSGKITVSDDIIYFVGNTNHVYAYGINDLAGEPTLVATVTDNSWSTFYGFNVINNYIFDADANSFTEPATVTIYNLLDASEIMSFAPGIGTNAFYDNPETMGTSEIAQSKTEITVYPNPVIDYIDVKGVDSAKIQVYNISGKLVKTVAYNGSLINMSDLKSGLYFFVITTAEAKVTKKVLVK